MTGRLGVFSTCSTKIGFHRSHIAVTSDPTRGEWGGRVSGGEGGGRDGARPCSAPQSVSPNLGTRGFDSPRCSDFLHCFLPLCVRSCVPVRSNWIAAIRRLIECVRSRPGAGSCCAGLGLRLRASGCSLSPCHPRSAAGISGSPPLAASSHGALRHLPPSITSRPHHVTSLRVLCWNIRCTGPPRT